VIRVDPVLTSELTNELIDLTLSLTNSKICGIVPKQICHFSQLSIFCLGCKTISRRAARRRLLVLHPNQA